uniref:L1 transposable element RRM domain-containing protein n=1 Tax=Sinocyclocheilus grahami TaxID=75366 RepID=A0A672SW74_SINGR
QGLKCSRKGISTSRMTTRQTSPPHESPSPQRKDQDSKMENVLYKISQINSTLQGVATDVSSIKEVVTDLKNPVSAIQKRLDEAEGRISNMEDVTSKLVGDGERHDKRLEVMWNRTEDLENRSRRNNVRMIGLKEGLEAGGMIKCVYKILSEGLGIDPDEEFEIERAHRAFTPRPDADRPPRIVLIKFLCSSAREKVLQAAREKGMIEWDGCRISFFPDMSRELARRRWEFTAPRMMLRSVNVKYTLSYPASLRFTWQGKNRVFTSSADAEQFIKEHYGPHCLV